MASDRADSVDSADPDDPLLSVRNLRTHFRTDEGTVRAVDGVSFDVAAGETVCLVGESGCGKTVTAESITRLFRSPPGEIVSGSVVFDGTDLTDLDDEQLRDLRGARIAHVFQNPGDALNPVYTVGWQLREALALHRDVTGTEADDAAADLLDRVGIPDARTRLDDYPHELSGGMRQRVLIAMALAGRPDLLIADEPTTALDVTVQAGILDLLADLQAEFGMSVLFITHDLGVVAEIADRVVVMYAGRVMEQGDVREIFDRPAHPYTRALLDCLPSRGGTRGIPGSTPDPAEFPAGCRFHPRCPHAVEACRTGERPPLHTVDGDDERAADGSDERAADGSDERAAEGSDDHAADGMDHAAACVYYGPGYDPAALDREPERDRP